MTGTWKPQLKPIIESWYRMSLNHIKGLAGEIGTTYAHRMQQEMIQDRINYVVSSDNFVKMKCDITPSLVKSFYEAKEAMERAEEESKLLQAQLQNKRLRAMVKKVIFSGDRTIIMWNDGTKTVTQCHELDVYDKEKGILACMAKKLYENTNLFNEVIQEYVDFDACNIESEENERLEQAKKTIDKLQTTLDAVNSTTHDLEKELAYYKRLTEKLTNDVDSLEILETLKEYKHYTKCLEEDLENEHLNRTEMENIYYSLQTQFDAYVKQCDEYIKDIDTLTERIKDMEESLEYKDNWIDSLQSEIYWLEEERNELQEELDNCKCHTAQ